MSASPPNNNNNNNSDSASSDQTPSQHALRRNSSNASLKRSNSSSSTGSNASTAATRATSITEISRDKLIVLVRKLKANLTNAENAAAELKEEKLTAHVKLHAADNKVAKAFQLLNQEKEQVAKLNKSIAKQKTLIKTQQSLLQQKDDDLAQRALDLRNLKEQIAKLESEREKLFRKDRLATVAIDEVEQLRATLARERVIREQEKRQRETEVQIEREERERVTLEHRRQLQYADDQHEAARKEYEVELQARRDAGERHHSEAGDVQAELLRVQALLKQEKKLGASRLTELQSMVANQNKLAEEYEVKLAAAVAEQRRKLQEDSAGRVAAEQQKEHELTALQARCAELQQTVKGLQSEINSGSPEERRLFELATLQARRDGSVRLANSSVLELKRENDDLRKQIRMDADAKRYLQKEVGVLSAALERESQTHNINYLYKVLKGYMQAVLRGNKREEGVLRRVLYQLLKFSERDIVKFEALEERKPNAEFGGGSSSSASSSTTSSSVSLWNPRSWLGGS